jgi:SAM-dependent methyltransferase
LERAAVTFNLVCADNSTVPLPEKDGEILAKFGYAIRQKNGIADLLPDGDKMMDRTADHYSEQWGEKIDFLSFIKANPDALQHMPSGQLGWPDLLTRIRMESEANEVFVYDAACGYGGIFTQLFAAPLPCHLRYLGVDIHKSMSNIERPPGVPLSAARFVRWDISKPLPIAEKFEYVVCRNALMHTAHPKETLRSILASLIPGGTIAVSVYARKALLREIVDDNLRQSITALPKDEALKLARQFTLLGRDLQESHGLILIKQDLPFLGIKAGSYQIQGFIYDHIIKCWYNNMFGEKYSDIVNFDWYHPPYAYRFSESEAIDLFSSLNVKIVRTCTIPSQHFIEATKLG